MPDMGFPVRKICKESIDLDKVQKFIEENQHQLGYIMAEASRKWIENDPVGALTVGDCNVFIERHGQYHEVVEKMERFEKALKEIKNYPLSRYGGIRAINMGAIATKALEVNQ